MRWKLKAAIQNLVSYLPSSVSYDVYYWLQRNLGGLRRADPRSRLSAGIETWRRIQKHGYRASGKVFLEVGTGWAPLVPLAYWLMGAERTVTIDLNPYLKEELIADHVRYIRDNQQIIIDMFGDLLDSTRFGELLDFSRGASISTARFLELCRTDYIAPGDAADTRLPDRSIDFHTSYTVLEHIPPDVLEKIVAEGARVLKDGGLFVHGVDYSDHFSHSDHSISAINFLQYPDERWSRYAGNRYMYMNRLRHDDYLALFEGAGRRIVEAEADVDARLTEVLASGRLVLDERFRSKSRETLAIRGSWIVVEKTGGPAPTSAVHLAAGVTSQARRGPR